MTDPARGQGLAGAELIRPRAGALEGPAVGSGGRHAHIGYRAELVDREPRVEGDRLAGVGRRSLRLDREARQRHAVDRLVARLANGPADLRHEPAALGDRHLERVATIHHPALPDQPVRTVADELDEPLPAVQEVERHALDAVRSADDAADEPALTAAPREGDAIARMPVEQLRLVPHGGHLLEEPLELRARLVGRDRSRVVLPAGLVHHRQRELARVRRVALAELEPHRRVVHRPDDVARERQPGDVVELQVALLGAAHGLHRHHVRPGALDPVRDGGAVEVDEELALGGVGEHRVVPLVSLLRVGVHEVDLQAGDAPAPVHAQQSREHQCENEAEPARERHARQREAKRRTGVA